LVRIEWLALDWRFQVREALGQSPIWSPDLVVVAIDEESARHLVVKVPTPRDYLARLVERVAAYRPRVIGIDILLDRPTEAKADWQLAQALRRASKVTKVVLPVQADGEPLLPLYQPLAAATGFADIRPDPDAITRRFRLFRQSDKGWQPSFVAALYRAATGEPASALGIQEPVLINYRHSPSFPSPFPSRRVSVKKPDGNPITLSARDRMPIQQRALVEDAGVAGKENGHALKSQFKVAGGGDGSKDLGWDQAPSSPQRCPKFLPHRGMTGSRVGNSPTGARFEAAHRSIGEPKDSQSVMSHP